MKRISILLSGLFIALVIFSSCSATQEKEQRTDQVDEPIYVQDSTAAVQLSDSADSMIDTLSELEAMDIERAQEKIELTEGESNVDLLEGDDQ